MGFEDVSHPLHEDVSHPFLGTKRHRRTVQVAKRPYGHPFSARNQFQEQTVFSTSACCMVTLYLRNVIFIYGNNLN